jgi:hypothetical protein
MSELAVKFDLDRDASTVTPAEFRAALIDHGVILLRNAVPPDVIEPLRATAAAMIEHFDSIPRDVIEREILDEDPAVRLWWDQKLAHGLHYNMDIVNFSRGAQSLFDPIRRTSMGELLAAAWPDHKVVENHVSPLHRIFPPGEAPGFNGPPLQMHVDAAFHKCDTLGLNFWTPLTPAGGERPGLAVLPLGVKAAQAYMEFNPDGHDGEPETANQSKFRNSKALLENLERAGLAKDLWRPLLNPGDILVFTNFTIHGTWCEAGMTSPRTSIEARVLLIPPDQPRWRGDFGRTLFRTHTNQHRNELMGVSSEVMAGMIREAKVKPIRGVSYSIGRQTMGATPQAALQMFRQLGLTPRPLSHPPRVDDATTGAIAWETGSIYDADFYKMLGCDEHYAVDISAFEGAEIIVDLNKPIPDHLEKTCDFLVDGSTLDNIFDPCQGLENIARMLKPGGRCVLVNMGNASLDFGGIPYTMFNPLWFYDYFAINGFSACDVYAVVHSPAGHISYRLLHEMARRQHTNGVLPTVISVHTVAIVVFAEKGENSTFDRMPTQHAYRPEAEWQEFERAVQRFEDNARPPLIVSSLDADEPAIAGGWYRIRPDGWAVEPRHIWASPFTPPVDTGKVLPSVDAVRAMLSPDKGSTRQDAPYTPPRSANIEFDEYGPWPGVGWTVRVDSCGRSTHLGHGDATVNLRLVTGRDYVVTADAAPGNESLSVRGVDLPIIERSEQGVSWWLESSLLEATNGDVELRFSAPGVKLTRVACKAVELATSLPRTSGFVLESGLAWPGVGWKGTFDGGCKLDDGRSATLELRLEPERAYVLILDVRDMTSTDVLEGIEVSGEQPLEPVNSGWLPDGGAHLHWKIPAQSSEIVSLRVTLNRPDPRLVFSGLRCVQVPKPPPPLPSFPRRVVNRLTGGYFEQRQRALLHSK